MELPSFMQVEPVGQCNLRCTMCPIQFRHDEPADGAPAYMNFEKYRRLVDGFPKLTELHLQGLGEPMMHPRFFDMVAYAAAKGVAVSINSNFSLSNARRADQLIASGLHTLHVSIDGATRQTYERIRVRGRFKKVLRNLKLLQIAKARRKSDRPYVRLVMVIMRQNLHELPGLVELAHRLSIQSMFVQHLAHDFGESSLPAAYKPMRDYVEDQTLLNEDPARIAYFFSKARDAAARAGVELRLPHTRMKMHAPGTPGPERCNWPWRGAYVSYQGLAMPCCMVATPDRMHFGNFFEDGIEPTWNAASYENFREALNSDRPPEICRSCSIYRGTF